MQWNMQQTMLLRMQWRMQSYWLADWVVDRLRTKNNWQRCGWKCSGWHGSGGPDVREMTDRAVAGRHCWQCRGLQETQSVLTDWLIGGCSNGRALAAHTHTHTC
jgi:hypothetical protein